jgi:hypothetical protein
VHAQEPPEVGNIHEVGKTFCQPEQDIDWEDLLGGVLCLHGALGVWKGKESNRLPRTRRCSSTHITVDSDGGGRTADSNVQNCTQLTGRVAIAMREHRLLGFKV